LKNIRLHPSADLEFKEAVKRYNDVIQGLGDRLIDEVEASFELISENSKVGLELEDNIRRIVLNKFPFSILYAEEEPTIYILAVAHQKREPGYWRNRT